MDAAQIPLPYQELGAHEIRMLKPCPSSSNTLSYELVHKSIRTPPKYSALSYTWGPQGNTHFILLNNRPFGIRRNLHDALQQFYNSTLVSGFLWVDAICINQGEDATALKERSVQITLMRQIYEKADCILVWLGMPENEFNNRLAFRKMHDFAEKYRHMQKKARPYRPWLWKRKPRTADQDVYDFLFGTSGRDKSIFDVPGSETYRAWLGICAVWRSPWWTRTWVFQEATIPESYTTLYISGITVMPLKSKVKFLCGDQNTSWNELAATQLAAASVIRDPSINTAFMTGLQIPFELLLQFRVARIQHILSSFLQLLQMFRQTECYDPRDKVYAPLCLAPEDVRSAIIPDYLNKSPSEVYLDVARFYLRSPGQNLDFLGYAAFTEHPTRTPNASIPIGTMPSWLSNWFQPLDITPIPKVLHVPEKVDQAFQIYDRRGVPSNKENQIPAFFASGDTTSDARIDGTSLLVRGIFCHIVKDVMYSEGPNAVALAREKGYKWGFESKGKYPTGEKFMDAWYRTVAMDVVYDYRGRASERGGFLDNKFLNKKKDELNEEEFQRQNKMRMAKLKAAKARDLAICEGDWLAMVPREARPGDGVWALLGGKVLYVLRRQGGSDTRFTYIGEAYVHSLMDGEIMRRATVGEAQVRNIVLT